MDSSSPLKLTNSPFVSVSLVSICEIVDKVIGRYTKFTGTSMILYPGPTFGKNEYITFPLLYEVPIIMLVTLKLLTLIISIKFSDSLYHAVYCRLLKPRTVLMEFAVVKSTT